MKFLEVEVAGALIAGHHLVVSQQQPSGAHRLTILASLALVARNKSRIITQAFFNAKPGLNVVHSFNSLGSSSRSQITIYVICNEFCAVTDDPHD